MFVKREGDPEIPLGNYLGDLTSEIDSATKVPNSRGVEASFLSPKTYALRIKTPCGKVHTIVKAKGITLTVGALEEISFDSMRKLAKSFCEGGNMEPLQIPQTLFRSDKGTQAVYTKDIKKIFQAVSDKRIVTGNDTRAYGYCKEP